MFHTDIHCGTLYRIFRLHDGPNAGSMVVGEGEERVLLVSKSEYADDAALIDENSAKASAIVTSVAKGSVEDAAMTL